MDKQQNKQPDQQPDYVDIGEDCGFDPADIIGDLWDAWSVKDNRRVYTPIAA